MKNAPVKNSYYNNFKLALSIFWTILGAVIFLLNLTGIIREEMFAGLGAGFLAAGILMIRRNILYRKDPAYREKMDIAASDERMAHIRMMTWSWAGYISILGCAVISLICLLTGSMETARILGLVVCGELIVYLVCYFFMNKKF